MVAIKRLLLIFVALLTHQFFYAHAFYVSIATLHYNEVDNHFEITLQVTTHDIESVIENEKKIDLNLGEKGELQNADALIKDYLNKEFIVYINRLVIPFDYIGKEVELDDRTFIYLEIDCPTEIQSVTVQNTILLDAFPNQENITYLENKANRRTHVFSNQSSIKTFDWNK